MTAKTLTEEMLNRLSGTSYPQWMTDSLNEIHEAIDAQPAAPAEDAATRLDNMHFETMSTMMVYTELVAKMMGNPAIHGKQTPALQSELARCADLSLLAGQVLQQRRRKLIQDRATAAAAAAAAAEAAAEETEGEAP